MPSINRTTIITGPALVTFGGQTFWSKGDISYKLIVDRFAVETSVFGEVDGRIRDKRIEVSFEPDGRFTSALAAVLFPYAAASIGASIFGASDRALVIHGRDGVKLTVPNASLTSMPALRLGVGKTLQGNVTFTGLLKNSTAPEAAGAYYAIASESYPGDTGWATSDIKTLAYASAWGGSAPWDAFLTQEGWEIAFGLQLSPQMVDGCGTVDMSLQALTVTATAIPVGPSLAQLHTAMHENLALGSSMASANDLIVSATGVYFSLANAGLIDMQAAWGSQSKRLGACQWQANRTVTTGVADPLFFIGTAAPV
jgi:hypothetical protein